MVSRFAVLVRSYQFQVGWTKPPANQTHSYNDWSTKNSFHIGDSLHFRYQRDSVLVVNSKGYESCNVSNPISKFDDGDTVFELDRYGLFYFISGESGHCEAGQKMVVRVMLTPSGSAVSVPSNENGSKDNESDGGDGWDAFSWGPPPRNSTVNLPLSSYLLTALGVVVAILYLLM
ncbi:hypothetical protein GH714_022981 [Hevea brasiliensis]|uniref:Phytocyanin domain-containing protein n=1 Tax=Hevea brasiliensis TaxID=3981 RepID=A0A6A6KLY4_HEVBR|nr:hypothetical protein GH714_022981 [Hevea brasiliensis]